MSLLGFIFSNSAVVLSELFHSFIDTFTIILSIFALKKVNEINRDVNYTYGLHRLEILTSILNVEAIVITSIATLWFSVYFLLNKAVDDPTVVIIASAIGFIGLLGVKVDRSVDFHILFDTIDYIIGIVVGLIIFFSRLYILDPISAIAIVLISLAFSYPVLKESYYILLEKSPLDIKAIENDLKEICPTTHHVHVWSICNHIRVATLHVTTPKELTINQADEIRLKIKKLLREKYNIEHVTVQFEGEEEKETL